MKSKLYCTALVIGLAYLCTPPGALAQQPEECTWGQLKALFGDDSGSARTAVGIIEGEGEFGVELRTLHEMFPAETMSFAGAVGQARALGYQIQGFTDLEVAERVLCDADDLFITKCVSTEADGMALHQYRLVNASGHTTAVGFVEAAVDRPDAGVESTDPDIAATGTVFGCWSCFDRGDCSYYWNVRYGGLRRTINWSQNYVGDMWNDDISSIKVHGNPPSACWYTCHSSSTTDIDYYRFWQHSRYRGDSFTLYVGENARNLVDTGWNDRISSIEVIRNWW